MKTRTIVLTIGLFLIVSCGRQDTFEKYETLINQVDSIQIDYVDKKISLRPDQVENLKYILLNHIKPEQQKQFKHSAEINLFKKKKLIANIKTIDNNNNAFANVYSDSLNFGFVMTYGIGMYLVEATFPEFDTTKTGQTNKKKIIQ